MISVISAPIKPEANGRARHEDEIGLHRARHHVIGGDVPMAMASAAVTRPIAANS